jgi:hypothetical protein
MDGQALQSIYSAYSEPEIVDSTDEQLSGKSHSRATFQTPKIATRFPTPRRDDDQTQKIEILTRFTATRLKRVGQSTLQLASKPNDLRKPGPGSLVDFALRSNTCSPQSSPLVRSNDTEDVTLASTSESISTDVCCRQPLYWHDIELHAWNGLNYSPQPVFEHQPRTIHHPESPCDLNNMVYGVLTMPDWSVYRLVDDSVSLLIPGRLRTKQSVERIGLHGQRSHHRWIAEGTVALDAQSLSLSDYTYKSLGNVKRMNGSLDWLQQRSVGLERSLAEPMGRSRLPGTPLVHNTIDGVQWGFWETYHFAVRVGAELLDEKLLNGLENTVDSTLNAPHRIPENEIIEE